MIESKRDKFAGAYKQIEIYRKMSGAQRLLIGCELYELAYNLISANIRQEFAGISQAELQKKVRERMARATTITEIEKILLELKESV